MEHIPEPLLKRAKILANELAWHPEDAIQVIEWLVLDTSGIVGVELWQDVHGKPRWLASSNYECDGQTECWDEFIVCCASAAKSFVLQFYDHPGALFNFSVLRP